MLRWFQVKSKGTQPYINMYPFSPNTTNHPRPMPSRLAHNIEQSFMCYPIGSCWLSSLTKHSRRAIYFT